MRGLSMIKFNIKVSLYNNNKIIVRKAFKLCNSLHKFNINNKEKHR